MLALLRDTARTAALLILAISGASWPLTAQAGEPRDTFVVPSAMGFVNDFADLLTAAEESRVEALAHEVQAKSRGEIAVVTLPSLYGLTAAEAARRIGKSWGVGYAGSPEDPGTQTGVVLLVAPREREYRLEVAAGAARFLSDSAATELLNVNLVPALRRSAYGEAIHATVRAVAQRFATRFRFTLEH